MRTVSVACVLCLLTPVVFAADGKLIDSMDDVSRWKVSKNVSKRITVAPEAEPKEGKSALHLSVVKGTGYAVTYRQFTPDADWNSYDGFSLWVKGDGSENFGCMRIQAGNWNKAWLGNFPLKDKDWHKVKIAWKDLVPSGHTTPELGDAEGFKPGDLNLISFGKSWNFTTKHTKPAIAFSIDNLRLIKGVKCSRRRVPIAEFPKVESVVKKMKAGEAVTILALGDSITWGTSAGGNANAYPALMGEMRANTTATTRSPSSVAPSGAPPPPKAASG